MKHRELLKFAMILAACVVTALPARAQQQIQQDIKQVQGQMDEVRRTGPSASANDLQALEARVKALDAAREADKKAIIDQLAKELAAMSGSHGGKAATTPTPATTGNEH